MPSTQARVPFIRYALEGSGLPQMFTERPGTPQEQADAEVRDWAGPITAINPISDPGPYERGSFLNLLHAVPGIGPPMARAGNEISNGEVKKGIGHGLGAAASALLMMRGLGEPRVPMAKAMELLPDETGAMTVEHYSPVSGLRELDPKFHGTGKPGAERLRKANNPKDYIDRTYLYRQGAKPEPGLGANKYVGNLDEEKIYDLSQDPLGLRVKAGGDATKLERLVKDSGFSGYSSGPAVAVFEKVPVTPAKVPMGTEQPDIRGAAVGYLSGKGIKLTPPAEIAEVDPVNARRIAEAYEAMPHNPSDPQVAAAYDALKAETRDQFRHLQDAGYKLEPWDKTGQPYANSSEMINDLTRNKHLYFFRGGEMPADHPLAEPAGIGDLTHNDLFRAVHDAFGHGQRSLQFGPKGEENAWLEHSAMFSPEAQKAMTTETRGQNSWVNFGPHADLPVTERPYAEQKAGLLPEEFHPEKVNQ